MKNNMKIKISIEINGKDFEIEALPETRLVDLLRNDLKLTGTKEGCGEGECGACTVILNGAAVNSCIILCGQLKTGDRLITIEGLSDGDKLSAIQDAFVKNGGVQCGICTPGMIMVAYALLEKNGSPTRFEIAEAIAGNLCRCTGYTKIIDSIECASAAMNGGKR